MPITAIGAVGRRPYICLGARRWPAPLPAAAATMPPAALQGLADLLPMLLCGEESAEHVFTYTAARLPPDIAPGTREALDQITLDEHRHGVLLSGLRELLPPPVDAGAVRRAARFLKSLATADLKLHLARIAGLDAGVCRVLTAIAAPGTPISAAISIEQVFKRIRQDESGHVRISRRCARQLGLSAEGELTERRRVQNEFADLLAPQSAAFSALGVDSPKLLRRLRSADEPVGHDRS